MEFCVESQHVVGEAQAIGCGGLLRNSGTMMTAIPVPIPATIVDFVSRVIMLSSKRDLQHWTVPANQMIAAAMLLPVKTLTRHPKNNWTTPPMIPCDAR